MKNYHELMSHILENGDKKTDRTGTGTISVFGGQLRFNLKDGFPLITTKKVHFKSIVHELIWLISGNTNISYLKDNNVRIWNEWATESGDLSAVYGAQWRRWETCSSLGSKAVLIKDRKCEHDDSPYSNSLGKMDEENSYKNTICNIACIGNPPDRSYSKKAYDMWEDMISKCYDKTHPEYPHYGGSGIGVEQRWKCFENFLKDLPAIPGFERWLIDPGSFILDKDYYNSNGFSLRTCVFIEKEWDIHGPAIEYNGVIFESIKSLSSFLGESLEEVATHHKHKINIYTPPEGFSVRRERFIDQLQEVINGLKNNPDSRRHIITAWNPGVLPDTQFSPSENANLGKQALPPCHAFFQFYSVEKENGRRELSCHLYQRSADIFLGVPFNIASYALLTHLVAAVTNHDVGDYIHSFGDVHIYNNHIEQVKLQLSREEFELPKIKINPRENIDDYVYEDIELIGYNHHPAIKAQVSI